MRLKKSPPPGQTHDKRPIPEKSRPGTKTWVGKLFASSLYNIRPDYHNIRWRETYLLVAYIPYKIKLMMNFSDVPNLWKVQYPYCQGFNLDNLISYSKLYTFFLIEQWSKIYQILQLAAVSIFLILWKVINSKTNNIVLFQIVK